LELRREAKAFMVSEDMQNCCKKETVSIEPDYGKPRWDVLVRGYLYTSKLKGYTRARRTRSKRK